MYSSSEPRDQPYVLSHLLKGQEGKPTGLLKDVWQHFWQVETELDQRSQGFFSVGFYTPGGSQTYWLIPSA